MGVRDRVPFEYDQDFKDDLERIKTEDRSRLETVEQRCEDILRDPFKGEWKGHLMASLYGEHVDDHWVILYQVEPNMAANGDPEDVDAIYFHRVIHHDNQESAVTNISSAGIQTEALVELPYANDSTPYDDLPAETSYLRDSDIFHVDSEEWGNDGVEVTGRLADVEQARTQFEALLPDVAAIEYTEPSVTDIRD